MATKAAAKVKTYLITNKRTGKVLHTSALGAVEQASVNYTDNELWITEKVEGNVFKIINKANNMVLDLVALGEENGTLVQVWENVESSTQNWELKTASRGYKIIKNVYNQKVLDIKDLTDDDGAVIQVWDEVGGDNQEWKITEYPVPVKKTVTKKKVVTAKAEEPKAKEAAKPAPKAKTATKPAAKTATKTATKTAAKKTTTKAK